MKTFTIDSNNTVKAHVADVWIADDAVKFTIEQELAALATTWIGPRLVEIWNKLPGAKPVAKFTNRAAGVTRIWKAIQTLEPQSDKSQRGLEKTAKKSAAQKKSEDVSGRQTKTSRVVDLLKRPTGATLAELMTLTGWQSHSVRGFLSAQVSKRMGLRVRSFKREGERVYRLRS